MVLKDIKRVLFIKIYKIKALQLPHKHGQITAHGGSIAAMSGDDDLRHFDDAPLSSSYKIRAA